MLPTEQLTFLEKGGPSGQPWARSQLLTGRHLSHYPNWPRPQLRTLWWLIPRLFHCLSWAQGHQENWETELDQHQIHNWKAPKSVFLLHVARSWKMFFCISRDFFSLADIIKIVILLNALICEELKKIYLLNTNLPRLRMGLDPDKSHISWKYCKLKTDLII